MERLLRCFTALRLRPFRRLPLQLAAQVILLEEEIDVDPIPPGVKDRLRDPRVVELLNGDVERLPGALDELDDHRLKVIGSPELGRP